VSVYGRFKSEEQTEATGTAEREEGEQPEETCGVIRAGSGQEKIAVARWRERERHDFAMICLPCKP
jgi:hypothetical protein